jgi:hypothetical protein
MADEQPTDTQTLRRMWSQSAAKLVERIRAGEKILPSEVSSLQQSLEKIEARETVERHRDLLEAAHG